MLLHAMNSPWLETVSQLDCGGIARQLAVNCIIDHSRTNDDQISLFIDLDHKELHTKETRERLAQALARHYGRSIMLTIRSFPLRDEPMH